MQHDKTSAQAQTISFREAFLYWLRLGFISFGGPAGQISMMHQELVEKRRWISEQRFLHALNYTMVLPGPVLLIALAWVYLVFGDVAVVQGILYGIKPAVTAIVLFAAYRIGSKALNNNILRGIAVLSFFAIFLLNIPFPYIVIAAGLIGIVGSHFLPEKFQQASHGKAEKQVGEVSASAVIDDQTPVPDHATFSWARVLRFIAVGVFLWVGVMAILTVLFGFGWQNTLTQMGWFFTKAAMVTFGGAYAVLPYVQQGGIEQYAWITAPQMIDGLALGETTPGPLIMIVAFVGFVGGWTKEIFGPEMQLLAGMAGACVATLFTFLPSFIFIFLGGPAVEVTRGDIKFTAPLTGITAAVVGVIVNLAVFFAYHVLWPQGQPV